MSETRNKSKVENCILLYFLCPYNKGNGFRSHPGDGCFCQRKKYCLWMLFHRKNFFFFFLKPDRARISIKKLWPYKVTFKYTKTRGTGVLSLSSLGIRLVNLNLRSEKWVASSTPLVLVPVKCTRSLRNGLYCCCFVHNLEGTQPRVRLLVCSEVVTGKQMKKISRTCPWRDR